MLKNPASIKQSGSAAFSVTLVNNIFTETCNGDFSFKKNNNNNKNHLGLKELLKVIQFNLMFGVGLTSKLL